MPAVDEPFGRTLVEAMLLGTVVVAGPIGLAIPRRSVTVSPAASCRRTMRLRSQNGQMLGLLAAPALATSLADAARRDALGRFGLRQHAEAIMRVYDTMLSTGSAGIGAAALTKSATALGLGRVKTRSEKGAARLWGSEDRELRWRDRRSGDGA